jgi:ABC-2 type transport system permease protein
VSRLLASELLKLRTTRTTLGFVLATLGLCALFVVLPLVFDDTIDTPDEVLTTLSGSSTAVIVVLVLGAVGMTGEHRHGSIVSTYLATPQRWRVIAMKAAAYAIAGAAICLASFVLAEACVGVWALGRSGVEPSLGEHLQLGLGLVVNGALLAAFGVGVGAIIRSQVGAVTTVLVLLLVLEPLLSTVVPAVGDFGVGGASSALSDPDGTDALPQALGGLLLLGWAALAAVLGSVVSERTDVVGG